MRLFIVRHGEAEPLRHTDADRALTLKGMADACALGKFLAHEQLHWDAIIVSPYIRARQTLDNILLSFPQHPPIIVNNTITPENAVAEAYDALATLGDAQNVLMVSHMPLVSALVASLVEGSQRAAHSYPMITASLAELHVVALNNGGGSLHRLISPPYNA